MSSGQDMHKTIYLIADRIRSLHNVGSLFRSADAFAVAKIYLCGYTGAPPRREIAKVALGAEQTVPWEKRGQTWKVVEELQKQGVQVVALEINRSAKFQPRHLEINRSAKFQPRLATLKGRTTSISIHKWHSQFPLALVVGNEVNGVSPSVLRRANAIVHIPMLGEKESLNVSVAAGVALYEIRCRDF